jgi:hypothetical protein
MAEMENNSSRIMNNTRFFQIVLVIIPVVFLVSSILTHSYFGYFYQRITDPDYFHLLNGINIALFNLATPYVDHPGTPLQIIVAISSWPVSLFFPGSISNNVIDHPEIFLTAAIITMNIIIALVMYFAGRKVMRYSNDIWLTMIIQLMPFGNIYALNVFGRLTPESFMIVPIMLMAVFLIRFIYDDSLEKLSNKQLLYLAMIGGMGMAIKFSYLPFLLLPIFVIRRFPQLLKYGIYSIGFTFLFAFPLIFNLSKSISWFGNMLINTGHWGEGSSGFMVWSEIPDKLWLLVNVNQWFAVLLLTVIFLTLFSTIMGKNTPKINRLNLISAGIILSIAFSMFLITKHFAYRYYFPTLLFQVILIYLIVEYARRLFQLHKIVRYLSFIAFTIFFITILIQVPKFEKKIKQMSAEHKLYSERSKELVKVTQRDIPIIIDAHYAGSPFPEFALNNAYLLCGNLKTTFQEKLRAEYPKSFFYVSWSDQFFHWNHFWDSNVFINTEEGLFVFIGENKLKDLDIIIERLEKSFPKYEVDCRLLLGFENPGENLYQVTFIP